MLQALRRVLGPSGFPYGSSGHLFKQAEFGRDSLEVAEDLLRIRSDVARTVILRLASLQGQRFNLQTEEEAGRIHHEHRALVMHGQRVDDASARIFYRLATSWLPEVDPKTLSDLTVYFTVDATPLYVRLISTYCSVYGRHILEEGYEPLRLEEEVERPTVGESARRAVSWVVARLEGSDLGLLEFRRMTEHSHPFQAWKDGGTSYLHPDATFANYRAPIASIEVQGLAYDALDGAGKLFPDAPVEERDRWDRLAERLQRTVFERFWLPGERYFAMALDRDPQTGAPRQVDLISANPAELLDTHLFDTLRPEDRQRYLTSIVERVFSPEFLTAVGVRSTSLQHENIAAYQSYQGAHTVWHKETYDIAKGLRRQGFPRLARELDNRLLNAVNVSGTANEFLYVMPDGKVSYRPHRTEEAGDQEIVGTNVPEDDQAWTVSAALAIKWRKGHPEEQEAAATGWEADLETRILAEIQPVALLKTAAEVDEALPRDCSFWVNTKRGSRDEHAFVSSHAL
jgi:glycogen debranching enzyme